MGYKLIIIIVLLLVAVVGYIRLYRHYRRNIKKVTFLFDAIDNGDFSFSFPTEKRFKEDKILHQSLNRIKLFLQHTREEQMDREKYYEQILNAVDTGILVNFETTNGIEAKDEFAAYGKDVAMQVAAANPSYVDEAAVPAEVVAKEKEILLAQMANDPKNANKPDAVKQKMIEGKIKKYFKENCLVDQEFVKDGDMTVGQYTAKVAKDLGGDIKVIKFTHFVKGEGLEKRSDDFAAEVASMVK